MARPGELELAVVDEQAPGASAEEDLLIAVPVRPARLARPTDSADCPCLPNASVASARRHAIGWCTVTSLVPSGKVASTWMSGIISATPSITSARASTVLPSLISEATLLPSRAPSMMAALIRATASGWLSFRPRARRRSASRAAVKIRSLSRSRGVRSIAVVLVGRGSSPAGAPEARQQVRCQSQGRGIIRRVAARSSPVLRSRQTRGGEASSCQASGRQARQIAASRSIAGSTRGASTRTTITPGSTAVAPAWRPSGWASQAARAASSRASRRAAAIASPAANQSVARVR